MMYLARWALLTVSLFQGCTLTPAFAESVNVIFQGAIGRPYRVPGALTLVANAANVPLRMGLDPTSPGRMYGWSNNTSPNFTKISTNAGVTWADVAAANSNPFAHDVIVTSTGRVISVETQTGPDCIVQFSDDSGASWTTVSPVVGSPNHGCPLYGSTRGDRVVTFEGTTGYIVAQRDFWKSTTNGASWVKIFAGDNTAATPGTIAYSTTLLSGVAPSGSLAAEKWSYTTGGDAWDQTTAALTLGCYAAIKMAGQYLVPCTRGAAGLDFRDQQGNIVYANVNLGAGNWIGSSTNGYCFDAMRVCYIVVYNSAAVAASLFYSRDDGATWTLHTAAFTPSSYSHSFQSIDGGESIFFVVPSGATNRVYRIDH